jgi:hypothetical protein
MNASSSALIWVSSHVSRREAQQEADPQYQSSRVFFEKAIRTYEVLAGKLTRIAVRVRS